jgi:hypothetical protein
MGQRLDLQDHLEAILGTGNVYFQPPPTVKMQYPCIVYKRDMAESKFADNVPYDTTWRYQVTVIDQNPDSIFPDKILLEPLTSFSRHFTVNGLNHDVFILYF